MVVIVLEIFIEKVYISEISMVIVFNVIEIGGSFVMDFNGGVVIVLVLLMYIFFIGIFSIVVVI